MVKVMLEKRIMKWVEPLDYNGKVSLDELENKMIPILMYSEKREKIFANFSPFCSALTDMPPDYFTLFRYHVKGDFFKRHSVYAMRFPFHSTPAYYGLSWYYFWNDGILYRLFYNGLYEFQKLSWDGSKLLVENLEYPEWVYQIMDIESGWKR